MTAESFPNGDVEERTLFGHPIGLSFLFGVEMWERFAFYGMMAIFILYMVNGLFLPGHVEHVIGYSSIKSIFESVLGPLSTQSFSSQVFGAYLFLAYFAPMFGGFLADRVLGQRRTVVIGATLLATGYYMMSFEALFFTAIPIITIGNGCFKPNISTQVGNLYAPGDQRRDRAFSVFYMGINVGGIAGPFLCGLLGETVGWKYGFLTAAIGMTFGLGLYLVGLRFLPQDTLTKAKATGAPRRPLDGDEWKAIAALMALAALSILFWAVWYQQSDTINLWTDENTDRHVAFLGLNFVIPTTSFQAVNGVFILLLTPFVTALWARQARRNSEPSTATKMAIGCGLMGLSFLFMLGSVAEAATDGKASWMWLIGFYFIYTTGELYLSPMGLSLVVKVAPARIVSLMMGVWFLSNAVGGYVAGWLGGYWEIITKNEFFLLMAAIAFTAGLTIWAMSRPLRATLKE